MSYSSEVLKDRYRLYSERFAAGSRVLDIGCGRGEFLELLRERDVAGVGVDADDDMVELVRSKGLAAEAADAMSYLAAHRGEFDGIFAAHLIEHLDAKRVHELVHAGAAALNSGGRLLLVTPNPHSLSMQLNEFWTDLQHVRFYTPEIVRYLLHEAGLEEVEIGENPTYRSGPEIPAASSLDLPEDRAAEPALHGPLGRAARLRQRLAEWLTAASTLERIQYAEDRATRLEVRSRQLAHELTRAHATLARLRDVMAELFPPAEFYATGTKVMAIPAGAPARNQRAQSAG